MTTGLVCGDLCGMKLNASKTKIFSMSYTINPRSTPWTRDGTVLKEYADLKLGVTFD